MPYVSLNWMTLSIGTAWFCSLEWALMKAFAFNVEPRAGTSCPWLTLHCPGQVPIPVMCGELEVEGQRSSSTPPTS